MGGILEPLTELQKLPDSEICKAIRDTREGRMLFETVRITEPENPRWLESGTKEYVFLHGSGWRIYGNICERIIRDIAYPILPRVAYAHIPDIGESLYAFVFRSVQVPSEIIGRRNDGIKFNWDAYDEILRERG